MNRPAAVATTVYERRKYAVRNVAQAKSIAREYLATINVVDLTDSLGLPEVDDRYHVWRVPTLGTNGDRLGEVVIDAYTSLVQSGRSTDADVIRKRQEQVNGARTKTRSVRPKTIARSELRNTIIQGDAADTLADLPAESIDLVFTSPPYFNARPDYTEYAAYEDYLSAIGRVVRQCHRLLSEGRFFVINVAPVLLRRASRSEASRRLAVPFDLHGIIVKEGFDFVDDIIWQKPEGAGWATGRGRRFAADRNPLQYKAVPVTEYVLVYRKRTPRLIDWNIRSHPDKEAVVRSRIEDDYEKTNVWRIKPTSTPEHPAVFPLELAEKVIMYYSFSGDVVLDPFAGSGTVGKACVDLKRRFVLSEMEPEYIELMKRKAVQWLGQSSEDVHCIGTPPIASAALF